MSMMLTNRLGKLNASEAKNTLLNPFVGQLLDGFGERQEAMVRSLYLAVRMALDRVRADRPSAVVFFQSSGYPLYMGYKALEKNGENLPPAYIFPLSSHHFETDSKLIKSEFHSIRDRTMLAAARTIKEAISNSENPDGPVYVIDEVLSGTCVTSLTMVMEEKLRAVGVSNDVHILAIADQRHMLFETVSAPAAMLIEEGAAYTHPLIENQNAYLGLKLDEVQISQTSVKGLIESKLMTFKNRKFSRMVLEGKVSVFPVLQLFTTDNSRYNPKLYLDRDSWTLQFNGKTVDANIRTHVTRLMGEFEATDFHLSYDKELFKPARFFPNQPHALIG